jgi:hypothetical protein
MEILMIKATDFQVGSKVVAVQEIATFSNTHSIGDIGLVVGHVLGHVIVVWEDRSLSDVWPVSIIKFDLK